MPTTVFIDKKYLPGFEENGRIIHPGCRGWIKYMKYRVYNQTKNCLMLVCGPTGSGKSWGCLSIAEMLMPEGKKFDVENIVFNVNDLIKRVRAGNLKRGDVIILEEAGVAAFKQNWYSQQNKALGALLQTFRSLGFIILFNLPSSYFFDSNSKRLIHFIWETQTIKNNQCIFKSRIIQVNERTNKVYYKRLRVAVKEFNRSWPATITGIPKPSQELIDAYETKKKVFQDKLYNKLEHLLDSAEAKEESEMVPRVQFFCKKCGHIWKSKKNPTVCPKSDCRRSFVEKYTSKSEIEADKK